jgi:GT2 family glycosyltransferase
MKLSIVIPIFNQINFTKSCLNDLLYLPNDHEIIVVDNGSSDDTMKVCQEFAQQDSKVKYIRLEENTGFAKASDLGYSVAQADCVLFLNNDIKVKENHSGWTKELIEKANQGYLCGPTGGLLDKRGHFIKETDRIESGNFYMSGWCLAANKSTYDKLILPGDKGPFLTAWGSYFEDSDMGLRAKELNIPFAIVPVPVVHFGRITSKKIGLSYLYSSAQKKFYTKWQGKLI